jgi:glycosyltransferase involved in cell wall biosynthesis
VNDGSTDESIECLERVWDDYPNCNVNTTIVHHPKNKGLAATRNTAITYCHGDYVVHVDSDDWIEPDAVELLVKRQQETSSDLVYTKGFYRHKKEGATKEDSYGWFPEKEKLLETFLQDKATISIWSKLIKKNLYIDNGICCNEQGSYYEDFQVLSRLIYYSSSIACLDDYIYHYNRTNPSSIVSNIPNDVEIQRQGLKSIQVVCDFFQDKDQHYLELVKRFYICYLYRMLNTNHRYNNREGYGEFWNQLEQLDKSLLGLNIQLSKPNYAELIDYMCFQVEDAFPLLRGEEKVKAFTTKLYKNAEFCISRDKGELVGMIAYYANGKGADFAYIAQAYVSPYYRKKGLFSSMLSNVEEDLIEKGFHEIRLEVDKQNENALH